MSSISTLFHTPELASHPEPVAAPDFVERRRALDPAHSFIIQAPAGSGKTGLLIQRYLKLLTLVDEPEEIVAITFTRKAAAEMRERLMAALVQARSTLPAIGQAARTMPGYWDAHWKVWHAPIENPVVSNADGTALTLYTGADARAFGYALGQVPGEPGPVVVLEARFTTLTELPVAGQLLMVPALSSVKRLLQRLGV